MLGIEIEVEAELCKVKGKLTLKKGASFWKSKISSRMKNFGHQANMTIWRMQQKSNNRIIIQGPDR